MRGMKPEDKELYLLNEYRSEQLNQFEKLVYEMQATNIKVSLLVGRKKNEIYLFFLFIFSMYQHFIIQNNRD